MKHSRRSHRRSKRQSRRRRAHRMRGGENPSYEGLSVLVTGGAGFIGSNLVDALLAAGAKVRVLDNLQTGKRANLEKAITSGRCEFMEGDIRNPETCAAACAGMNVVFHEAALVSVPLSMTEPRLNHEINITGTLNMLVAAAAAGVSRFVYASSAATYGSLPELPKRESQPRDYPSPYALSKGVDEDYANQWAAIQALGNGMTCIGLRYFNVYGPRQDPKSPYSGVISIFVDRIARGTPITVNGDGLQTRDFVFVGDIVYANMLAGKAVLGANESRVFNVGTGKSVTLLELVDTIKRITGNDVAVSHGPERAGDIKHSLSDITKISTELGYAPKYTLEEGLRLLIESL
jgi:nucleoside-diphosphate-sugar epimerase